MIDILVPVLGRPHNARPLVESINAVTNTSIRILFLCTQGDTAQIDASSRAGAEWVICGWPAGRGDYARKINHGLRHTEGEWVFMGADDIRFEAGWDTHALKAAGDQHDVVATNDMANAQVKRGDFGTHCLIRRRYVTDQGGTADGERGVVLFEGYDHNYVDRELCHVAQSRNRFVFARHSRVRHYHPLWKTAPFDATYKKGLRHGREDQALFYSRAHLWDYVGLSAEERKLAA